MKNWLGKRIMPNEISARQLVNCKTFQIHTDINKSYFDHVSLNRTSPDIDIKTLTQ